MERIKTEKQLGNTSTMNLNIKKEIQIFNQKIFEIIK